MIHEYPKIIQKTTTTKMKEKNLYMFYTFESLKDSSWSSFPMEDWYLEN